MKTREELIQLIQLKNEYEALKVKFQELSEEELEKVAGGTTKEEADRACDTIDTALQRALEQEAKIKELSPDLDHTASNLDADIILPELSKEIALPEFKF